MAAWGSGQVREYAGAAAMVGLATAVCFVVRDHVAPIDVAMLLLVAVVFAAARYARGPAIAASLLSIAAFNFFFVPPYYTFNVRDGRYWITFAVMLVVALAMSRLTMRIREQRETMRERERRTAALYALERDLAAAPDIAALSAATTRHLGRYAGAEASLVLPVAGSREIDVSGLDHRAFENAEVRMAAAWALDHAEPAGWGAPRGHESAALVLPLLGAGEVLGLAVLQPAPSDFPADPDLETLTAMANRTGDALERRRLAEQSEKSRGAVEAERLRSALLSSLSHDLRTPLGSIEGAASSLLEERAALGGEDRRELAEAILEESRRMSRLVTNLLNMVRVETGDLAVAKSWQPLEEPLGVALLRMEERLHEHPFAVRLPHDLPLVPVDELLLEQVFLNLLENAVRHTPPGTPIEIGAWTEGAAVVVEVADRGPGVPVGEEEAVFGRFYRVAQDERQLAGGAGLGLTICRGIVTAHGGRIWIVPGAEMAGRSGTVVRFTLPLAGPPRAELPAEPADAARETVHGQS
jgi:two-component system sensor histidine kinase KdpD